MNGRRGVYDAPVPATAFLVALETVAEAAHFEVIRPKWEIPEFGS